MDTRGFCVLNNEIVSMGILRSERNDKRWLPLSNLENCSFNINEISDVYYYLELYKSGHVKKEFLDYFFNRYGIACLGGRSFFLNRDLKNIRNPDLALDFLKLYNLLDAENGILLICEKLRRSGLKFEEKDVFVDDVELRGENKGCYIEPNLKRLGLFNSLGRFKGSNERQTIMLLNLYSENCWILADEREIRSEIYKRYHKYVTQVE